MRQSERKLTCRCGFHLLHFFLLFLGFRLLHYLYFLASVLVQAGLSLGSCSTHEGALSSNPSSSESQTKEPSGSRMRIMMNVGIVSPHELIHSSNLVRRNVSSWNLGRLFLVMWRATVDEWALVNAWSSWRSPSRR